MNEKVRERDVKTAETFLAGKTNEEIDGLYKKYFAELSCQVEIREDEIAVACYMSYREGGAEPVWAAMSAARKGVAQMKSTASFCEHARRRMSGMGQMMRDMTFGQAKEAGIDTHGKYHMSGLGPASDPKAWVSGPDDVRAVCKERNLTSTGMVNYQGSTKDPEFVELADDVIDEVAYEEMMLDPVLREKCTKQPRELMRLRGHIKEKYGTPKSQRPTRLTTRDG